VVCFLSSPTSFFVFNPLFVLEVIIKNATRNSRGRPLPAYFSLYELFLFLSGIWGDVNLCRREQSTNVQSHMEESKRKHKGGSSNAS
jgi:hypothetical protein